MNEKLLDLPLRVDNGWRPTEDEVLSGQWLGWADPQLSQRVYWLRGKMYLLNGGVQEWQGNPLTLYRAEKQIQTIGAILGDEFWKGVAA